jgi:hypothetical protein
MRVCSSLHRSVHYSLDFVDKRPNPYNSIDNVLPWSERFPEEHLASLAPSLHIADHSFDGQPTMPSNI